MLKLYDKEYSEETINTVIQELKNSLGEDGNPAEFNYK